MAERRCRTERCPPTRCPRCDACRVRQAAKTLSKYRERRDFMIVFLGGKCAGCGTTDDLDVHHKNPAEKSFAVSKFWSIAWERLVLELSKCELRCRNDCHKRETRTWRSRRWEPGPPPREYGPSDYVEPAGAEF